MIRNMMWLSFIRKIIFILKSSGLVPNTSRIHIRCIWDGVWDRKNMENSGGIAWNWVLWDLVKKTAKKELLLYGLAEYIWRPVNNEQGYSSMCLKILDTIYIYGISICKNNFAHLICLYIHLSNLQKMLSLSFEHI